MTKKVLSIGSCSFDNGMIQRLISGNFNAELSTASLPGEAFGLLRDDQFDLVLVNRILEANGSHGIDVVTRLKSDPQLAPTPVMLVSNFPQAQNAAVEAGAELGFGKAELDRTQTVERLAAFLRG